MAQIHKRGRDYENSISIEYLSRLNERYEAWVHNYDKGKILIIDVDQLNFVDNKADLKAVIEKIDDNIPELYLRQNPNTNQIGKVMEIRQITSNKYLENSCGISHLIGNAWEMTNSVFQPFDGFVKEQYYPEYSTDFFDNYHYVLKGCSWATPKHLIRPSFRNFYQDLYRYNITQFRMVRDI